MRLSQSSGKTLKTGGSPGFIFLITGILVAMFVIAALTGRDPATAADVIFCDAESVDDSTFITGGHRFHGGQYRSNDRAYEGQYSCKLGQGRRYGIRYDMEDLAPGDRYKASVWVSRTSGNRGNLVVAAEGDHSFYEAESIPVFRNDEGWELVQLYFQVPYDIPTLRVYVYVEESSGAVYFDNFKIEHLSETLAQPDTITGPLTTLIIDIDQRGLEKLERKKWDAVADGILITEDDDWVDARLHAAGTQLEGRIRLKGDWLDHLTQDKWSLRINMKGDQTWNRLSTFSIQSPATRFFLREWLYHKFLEAADVLTPRYDFIRLKLGDRELGVYAYEEHFEKQLVESKQRREGPIIKLNEDGFWQSYQRQENVYGSGTLAGRMNDAFWQSEIEPFKENKTARNPLLAQQFERAQDLLYNYKYGLMQATEVFDLSILGRYFAITDLHMAYHGLAWHNLRFYYNPVTGKLEPIGFDGFGGLDPKPPSNGPFLGYYAATDEHSELFNRLFGDADFVQEYHKALMKYSDPEWFQALLTELSDEIQEREAFLAEEFTESALDLDDVRRRVREVRYYLDPIDNISLSARTHERQGQYKTVRLTNHFHLPLEAMGYTGANKSEIRTLKSAVFVPRGGKFKVPESVDVTVPDYAEHIVFHLAGIDSLHTTTISPFRAPIAERVKRTLTPTDTEHFDFLEVVGNEAVIRHGTYTIDRQLTLPAGMRLIVEPGTEIDLINKAGIAVHGAVIMRGQEGLPIVITSSDQSASGFIVLGAGERSELQYVRFDGLNTLREEGHVLTGAVTFHESNVTIRHCSILNNQCEDALNTIRCQIEIEGLLIRNTLFDGYDSDFCEGTVARAFFREIANDALDFSGSAVVIEDCYVDKAGDKGISVGEESHITLKSGVLEDCNIGVASKDLSVLEINEVTLINCRQGFTAYQKKPEFGPATLIVHRYEMSDVDQPYLIERNSILKLQDQTIEGI